jgi:hypothetical protein
VAEKEGGGTNIYTPGVFGYLMAQICDNGLYIEANFVRLLFAIAQAIFLFSFIEQVVEKGGYTNIYTRCFQPPGVLYQSIPLYLLCK